MHNCTGPKLLCVIIHMHAADSATNHEQTQMQVARGGVAGLLTIVES